MVLDFLNGIYPFLYIPLGLVAIALGVDRALKSEEEESDVLKVVGGVSGLFTLALTIILAINEYNGPDEVVSNYTILFALLLAMSLIARPFKELPLAFVISVIVALGLLYVLLVSSDGDGILFGTIPLQVILITVMIIVILVFIISFIQEQAIDGLMFILGWGPVITFLGVVIIVQAITLLVNFPNQDGILSYLPG